MEVVGLTLGIPGFIAIALQTYSAAVRSISEYHDLPRELQLIISDISFEEKLFAGYVSLILENYMAEEDRTSLILTRGREYNSSSHQETATWESRLQKLEEELTDHRKSQEDDEVGSDMEFSALLCEMRLIKEIGDTVEAINEIKAKYIDPKLKETHISSIEGHTDHIDTVEVKWKPSISSAFKHVRLKLKSNKSRGKNSTKSTSSTPSRPSLFFRDVLFKLNKQLIKLKEQNKQLSKFLQQRTARNDIYSRGSSRRPLSGYKGTVGTHGSGKGLRSQLSVHCSMREFSSKLYQALSEHRICCEQHELYLCLNAKSMDAVGLANTNSVLQIVSNTACEPVIQFTALVTTKLPIITIAEPRQKALEITSYDVLEIRNALLNHNMSPCPQNLCERKFLDATLQNTYYLSDFHLQHQRRRLCSTASTISPAGTRSPSPSLNAPIITLREIVLPESGSSVDYGCYTYQRIVIAANLVKAATSFHSSPWVRSWSTRSIAYFRGLEVSDDIDTWKPHIVSPFNITSDDATSSDIRRALAILLTEVAGVDMGTETDQLRGTFERRANTTSKKLGRSYRNLIKQLWDAYQQSDRWGEERNEEGRIDELCIGITKELEELAECFS